MTSTNRTHTDQVARHRLRKWRLAVVPMALLAPLGLVACGGGDASANPTTTTASGSTQNGSTQNNTSDGRPNREAMQKYTACLSEHGVTLPDRGEAPEAPSGQAPADGQAPPTDSSAQAPPRPADAQAPDGSGGQDGPGRGAMFGLDTSDATVAAAISACSDLAPQMPQGGPNRQGSNATSGSTGEQRTDTSSTTTTTAPTP